MVLNFQFILSHIGRTQYSLSKTRIKLELFTSLDRDGENAKSLTMSHAGQIPITVPCTICISSFQKGNIPIRKRTKQLNLQIPVNYGRALLKIFEL